MELDRKGGLLNQGDPAVDTKAFRGCLGQFGTGVAVITARTHDGEIAGMTVNSFSSVSLDPPLILWSIRTGSRSAAAFLDAEGFVVDVLGSDQIDVVHHFASSGRNRSADKDLMRPADTPADTVAPLLSGAVAHFECILETTYQAGDHIILIGRVRRFARYSGKPLLFVQGQFGVAAPHPDLQSEDAAQSKAGESRAESADIIAEIFDARNQLSRAFQSYRRAEGVGLAEGRVLRRVDESPGLTWEKLLDATFLGETQLADTVGNLMDRGCLAKDKSGAIFLTNDGRRLRRAVRERWQIFRKSQIRRIEPADLEIALAVIRKIIAGTGRDAA